MTGFILDDFLPYQLSVLAERVSHEFSALYRARFGIGVAEWRVVAHLSQHDEVSVREIYARVAMDKSKVSRAASRLETAGYITKAPNPGDGRLVSLALTDKGLAMVAELTPMAQEFEARVLDRLGPDADAFRAALGALYQRPDDR